MPRTGPALAVALIAGFAACGAEAEATEGPSVGRVRSADGVEIVYQALGDGEPTLVFIHGGFADRTFWSDQMAAFSDTHRVIALDLAGHGASGKGRKRWDVASFAQDLRAVVEKEAVTKAVLIGNSLGGTVAMELAAILPDRVIGIVGVDTFQNLGERIPPEVIHEYAEAFGADYPGTLRKMVGSLLHDDVTPAFHESIERRMLGNGTREMAVSLMESYASFEWPRIPHPIRCINGDLVPTDVQKLRAFHQDFDAVILEHTGHYPMLEKPALFNEHLLRLIHAFAEQPAVAPAPPTR